MTKHEKIAALLRMTVDRGCTAAEAETARRLVAKLQAERAPTETIVRRFDPPVTLDRHRSRGSRTTRAGAEIGKFDGSGKGGKERSHGDSAP
jgi:hypothetical protein